MYPSLEIYQIKQPAMPLSPNSKRISAQIIVKYIKIPQKQAIPMYPLLQTFQVHEIFQIYQINLLHRSIK